MKNTVTIESGEPKSVLLTKLKVGQYAVLEYGGEQVIVVKIVTGQSVGLDGHHTFEASSALAGLPLKQGNVITITCGEQI